MNTNEHIIYINFSLFSFLALKNGHSQQRDQHVARTQCQMGWQRHNSEGLHIYQLETDSQFGTV